MANPRMVGAISKPIPHKERKANPFDKKCNGNPADNKALGKLLANKTKLTRQQYKTLKGQILTGDAEGAMRGLERITEQKPKGDKNNDRF